MTKQLLAGTILALLLVGGSAAFAQPSGRWGPGMGWGNCPWVAAPVAPQDPQTQAKLQELLSEIANLHQQIRELNWEIWSLRAQGADEEEIRAKLAQQNELRSKLHELNVKRSELGAPGGFRGWRAGRPGQGPQGPSMGQGRGRYHRFGGGFGRCFGYPGPWCPYR